MAPKRAGAAGAAPDSKRTATLKVGSDLPAPLPPLLDEAGNTVDLTALSKESGLVLFFFPKANTGGCTKQAALFSEHIDAFTTAGYKVFGSDLSSAKVLSNWKSKQGYKLTFLQGTTEFFQIFGAAKGDKGVNRSHIVVEKGGRIALLDVGVKPAQVPEVLTVVQQHAVSAVAPEEAKKDLEAAKEDGAKVEAEEKMEEAPPAPEEPKKDAAVTNGDKPAEGAEAVKEGAGETPKGDEPPTLADPTVPPAEVTDTTAEPEKVVAAAEAEPAAAAPAVTLKDPEPPQELASAAAAEAALAVEPKAA